MEQFFRNHPLAIGLCMSAFLLGSALFGSFWGLLLGIVGFVAGGVMDAKDY